ncbi:MAG: response regulator, partial [Pseudomonadota bacterium]
MAEAKILVVEDDAVVAKDICGSLENLGYGVPALVSSGEDAVAKAGELRPDLVLMDIRLKKGMDGIEAAETIRSSCNIPIVYLTAYSDDDTLRRAKATQPYGYILKPFEERELHTIIEIALFKHRMEASL